MELAIIHNPGSSATLQALGEKPSTIAAHANGCEIHVYAEIGVNTFMPRSGLCRGGAPHRSSKP